MQRFLHARQQVQASDSRLGVSRALEGLLAQLLPSEMAALPGRVGDLLTSDPAAVPYSALDLTRIELDYRGDAEVAILLRDIAHVYVLASNRLSSLDAKVRLVSLEQ